MTRKSHDPLFKRLFGEPRHAAALLRHTLPPDLVATLDLDTLTPVKTALVDDHLSERYTDLLFSLQTTKGPMLAYILIEHQSLTDPNMPLRVLEYLVRVWVEHRRLHPDEPLPPIVPIVISHPPDGWDGPVCFEDLFENASAFIAFIPRFELPLVDLSELSSTEINRWSMDVARKLALWMLRDSRAWQRLLDELPNWQAEFETAAQSENGLELLTILFRYIANPQLDLMELRRRLRTMSPVTERAVMTAGERLIQEGLERGLERGRQEGRQEGCQEGLMRGRIELLRQQLERRFGRLPDARVARLDAASLDELDAWALQLLDASTLDEVFAG